jgi:hypothetical protein
MLATIWPGMIMHYNFARYHQSLGCSPAMAADVSKKLGYIEDIVALLD